MCGQCGVAGTVTVAAERSFQHMLIYNSVRGMDSTGAASVKRHEVSGVPQVVVAKEVGHAFELLSITRKSPDKDFSSVISGTQRALLGHCRAQTRGQVSRSNAHPFHVENILGTHNGTLSFNTEDSLGDYKFQTDSQKIFASINDNGIADTVSKFKKGPTDAYALVWYDLRDNTLNFLRNKERPLYFGFDSENETIFWSSEFYHLAAGMSNIKTEGSKYIQELPPDMHYSWVVPEVNKKFSKAHVVKREGKDLPLVTHGATKYYDTVEMYPGVYGTDTRDTRTTYTGNGGKVVTDPTGYGASMATYDRHAYVWKKWSVLHSCYLYAWTKDGLWYNSLQSAWDSLKQEEKVSRYKYNQYPGGINIDESVSEEASRQRLMGSPAPAPLLTESNVESVRQSLMDKFKEKKAKEQLGSEFRAREIFRDSNRRVFWDDKDKEYTILEWQGVTGPDKHWKESRQRLCPDYVPFTNLDVSARHDFVSLGKKGHKIRAYRGFEGAALVKQSFDKLMAQGCLSCQRIPQWGNPVSFINYDHFVCQYCALDKDLVSDLRQMNRKKG